MSVHKNINTRFTKAKVQSLITEHIIPMLRKNKTFTEITEELRSITGKSKSQCERYIKLATESLSETFNRDMVDQRIEAIEALRGDLFEAYTNYQMADQDKDRVAWWKEYQSVKKRIIEISPLTVVSEEEGQSIKVEYTLAKKGDNE